MITTIRLDDKDHWIRNHPDYTPTIWTIAGAPPMGVIMAGIERRLNQMELASFGPCAADVPMEWTQHTILECFTVEVTREPRPVARLWGRCEDGVVWATREGWSDDEWEAELFERTTAVLEQARRTADPDRFVYRLCLEQS
jgi:hypothetical protein